MWMKQSYLTEDDLSFSTSWSTDSRYTIYCLEHVYQLCECLCVCVFFYCRIRWHTRIPVPWGIEEGGIWQTCGHLGLWWVAQGDTHICHIIYDHTQKTNTLKNIFCVFVCVCVCVCLRGDPLHPAGGLPSFLGWGPAQAVPTDQGWGLRCETPLFFFLSLLVPSQLLPLSSFLFGFGYITQSPHSYFRGCKRGSLTLDHIYVPAK